MQSLEAFKFSEFPNERIMSGLKYIILEQYKTKNKIQESLLRLLPQNKQALIYEMIEAHVQYQELQSILESAINLTNVVHPSRARSNLLKSLEGLQDKDLFDQLVHYKVENAIECFDRLDLSQDLLEIGLKEKILNSDYIISHLSPYRVDIKDLGLKSDLDSKELKLLSFNKVYLYFSVVKEDWSLVETIIIENSNSNMLELINDLVLLQIYFAVPPKYFNFCLNKLFNDIKPICNLKDYLKTYQVNKTFINSLIKQLKHLNCDYLTFDFINENLSHLSWESIKNDILDAIHYSPIPSDFIDDLCAILNELITVAPSNVDLNTIYDTQKILNINLMDIPFNKWHLSKERVVSLIKNIFQPSANRQHVINSL